MDNQNIDEFISSQLTSDEIIESKYSFYDGWDYWLLTNKRIIRYKKDWLTKKFQDLSYKFIVSIKMEEIRYYNYLIISIPLILISIILLADLHNDSTRAVIGIIALLLGIILTIAAFGSKHYCEIISLGVNKFNWIIPSTSSDVQGLIRDIRKHL